MDSLEIQRRQAERIAMLKTQVANRELAIKEQRKMFYKEILKLKEQIFGQKEFGEQFNADETSYFNPEEWLAEFLGDENDVTDDLETIAKKTQKVVQKLSEDYEKERIKLESKLHV